MKNLLNKIDRMPEKQYQNLMIVTAIIFVALVCIAVATTSSKEQSLKANAKDRTVKVDPKELMDKIDRLEKRVYTLEKIWIEHKKGGK